MRLNKNDKYILMGNIELLNKCKEMAVDINKLKKCNVEQMGNHYVFVLSKDNVPKQGRIPSLANDIATQPDIILIMTVEDNKSTFETTEYTPRILRINNRKKV